MLQPGSAAREALRRSCLPATSKDAASRTVMPDSEADVRSSPITMPTARPPASNGCDGLPGWNQRCSMGERAVFAAIPTMSPPRITSAASSSLPSETIGQPTTRVWVRPEVSEQSLLTPLSALLIKACWRKRSPQVYPVTASSGKTMRSGLHFPAISLLSLTISPIFQSTCATLIFGVAAAALNAFISLQS